MAAPKTGTTQSPKPSIVEVCPGVTLSTLRQDNPLRESAVLRSAHTSRNRPVCCAIALAPACARRFGVFHGGSAHEGPCFAYPPVTSTHPHAVWLRCAGGNRGDGLLRCASRVATTLSHAFAGLAPTSVLSSYGNHGVADACLVCRLCEHGLGGCIWLGRVRGHQALPAQEGRHAVPCQLACWVQLEVLVLSLVSARGVVAWVPHNSQSFPWQPPPCRLATVFPVLHRCCGENSITVSMP